ncbi:hypothetical protein [Flavobacterium sp.]|uniref:hypothetical protein n=1 Tax=Flavobacterium sp. TaxID=239 RepID=UPI00260BC61A|nr:hypothetical protein [Flavobacterium sp.]
MKENLNKNIITVLVLEVLAIILSASLNIFDSPFVIFLGIAIFLINVSAVILLIKHKPKFYFLTSIIALSIFLAPILFVAYAFSKIQC